MKIYLIIIQDRHYDVEVLPRTDMDIAIENASVIANRMALSHKYRLIDDNPHTNVLYFAQYSCEGDCVYVIEAELI